LRVVYSDPGPLTVDAAALLSGQLEPMAFDVRAADTADGPRWTLLVRFASSPAAVAAQLDAARALLRGETTALREGLEARVWAEQVALPWNPSNGETAVVRCSWLPADLATILASAQTLREQCGVTLTGRVGVGSGLLRLTGADGALAKAIHFLRGVPGIGHVVVLRGSRVLRAQVDVWGAAPSAPALALKRALDPTNILNAGRGPV